jgi:hypothetical protein
MCLELAGEGKQPLNFFGRIIEKREKISFCRAGVRMPASRPYFFCDSCGTHSVHASIEELKSVKFPGRVGRAEQQLAQAETDHHAMKDVLK